MRILIAAMAFCALPAVATGQVSAVAGAGSRGCAQMQSDVADLPNVRRAYVSWMQGYLSGRNAARGAAGLELIDLADFEAQWDWLVAWCGGEPERAFADGVDALFAHLVEVGSGD